MLLYVRGGRTPEPEKPAVKNSENSVHRRKPRLQNVTPEFLLKNCHKTADKCHKCYHPHL